MAYPNEARRLEIARNMVEQLSADIVARAAGFVIRNRTAAKPVVKAELENAIAAYLRDYSVPNVKDVATGTVTKVYGEARDSTFEEAEANDQVAYYEYSALLDGGTCVVCRDADGTTAQRVEELPPAPNPQCLGGPRCRCIHVAVLKTERGNDLVT